MRIAISILLSSFFQLTFAEERLNNPDKCLNLIADDKRNLVLQIEQGLLKKCEEISLSNKNKTDLFKLNSKMSDQQFLDDIKLNALKNASVSLIKYQSQMSGDKTLSIKNQEMIISQICKKAHCTLYQKKELKNNIDIYSQRISEDIQNDRLKHYESKEEMVLDLNERINVLKKQQYQLSNTIKSKGIDSPEAKSDYELYLRKYIDTTKDTLGSLITTDAIQSKMGKANELSNFVITSSKGEKSISYPEHKTLEKMECQKSARLRDINCSFDPVSKISQAQMEAKDKILEYVQKVNEAKDLKSLVKIAPIAVGQSLYSADEKMFGVCSAIYQISQDDLEKEKYLEYADKVITGLDVASVGALASGVAAGGGAGLEAVSLAGRGLTSVARKAIFKDAFNESSQKLLTYSSISAGVSGNGKILRGHYELKSYNEEYNSALSGRLAESRSLDEYQRAIELEKKYDESVKSVIEGGLEISPSVAYLNKIRKAEKYTDLFGKENTLEGKILADEKLTQSLYYISKENPTALKKINDLFLEKKITNDQKSSFLAALSTQKEDVIKKVLEKINQLDKNNPELEELVREPKKIIERACGI